jgi:uncharacterized membrane protein
MVNRGAAILSACLIAIMFIAGLWAMTQIAPDTKVAIHFDSLGQPNGFTSPARAFAAIPLVALAVWGMFVVIPRIDSRGANIARSAKAYGAIWIAVIATLAIIQGSLIARAFGMNVPANRLAMALIGVILVVVGNVMGKIRPNYSVGLRTPWALLDEQVWDKTHRFGGRAFVVGGLALTLAAFTLPSTTPAVGATLGVIMVVVVVTTLKSYLLWRERR